jgi:hypothetical protein
MRLLNEIFENDEFVVDEDSLGYVVRDIINMNWWNTSGVLIGYRLNRRISAPFTETQKLIAVQLKEFYRQRIIATKNQEEFLAEMEQYVSGKRQHLPQLSAWSMLSRANPSQYFTKNGKMTWVDCTSRATYAAKYVYQNGYIDWDGKCRVLGAADIIDYIKSGKCEDLGVTDMFVDGVNLVKEEIFKQKNIQMTVADWCDSLKINVLAHRRKLFDIIAKVKTDPFKNNEKKLLAQGNLTGVNECLYGFHTMASASDASDASYASAASNASRASDASNVSDASRASDAGCTSFKGLSWEQCSAAIRKPAGLEYPKEFRSNIFAIAGNWKIDKDVVSLARLGWFDPFSGHGTSPLYAKKHNIRYVGFDTNSFAFQEYLEMVACFCREFSSLQENQVILENRSSTVFIESFVGKFDLCYTSPPYFNFEEYGGNRDHYSGCQSYMDFHRKITIPVFTNVLQYLVTGGVLALQTEKNATAKKLWSEVIRSIGFVQYQDSVTGREKDKYSTMSKRDQSLLLFIKPE